MAVRELCGMLVDSSLSYNMQEEGDLNNMSKLGVSVNACLKKMSSVGGVGKGSFGEKAVFKVCEELYQNNGGLLYHSYSYKTDPTKAGNIKKNEQGVLFIENVGKTTEIDVLFVTNNKIFVLEVKAYKAKEIILTDKAITGCYITDKSPVHQNEMHCRHLYPAVLRAVPEGDVKFIEPIVVFVDKCRLIDKRSDRQKSYINVTVLDQLKGTLQRLNRPLDYLIDLNIMAKCLSDACVSSEKVLPCRMV